MGKRARGNGGVFQVKGSRFWWISYQLNGKTNRESSGELTKTAAAGKLKARLLAIGNGNFLGPRIEKITVDELYEDLVQDYRINGQAVEWAESVWNVHLKDFFSGMRAANLGSNQIAAYVEKRRKENTAPATVNRELALLRRAFSIAFDAEPQKVSRIPKFRRFITSEKGNERRGFVEEPQYRKLMDAAGPLWLRGLMAIAYNFGFRRGELLGNPKKGTEPMRCSQVDLLAGTVTLYSGETKNDEGRTVALTEECRLLLTELRRGKKPEDYLFTREKGEVIKDFRGTWDKLTEAAGVPGLLFHDFRRSSVRNMIRRGVPQKTARTVSGHKTDAVFSRYNIVSEDDIRDAARRIEEGAKAAVSGVIHSSFIVAPDQGTEEVASKDRKPS
jgi:integrase